MFILSIDQGTSSTKTLIINQQGEVVARGSEPLQTFYHDNGFVEQEPEAIYQNVLASVKNCLEVFTAKGYAAKDIVSIGIDNQRETFVVWDSTGKPLCNAVLWQCKRSVQICADLKQKGLAEKINQKTGLVIDPYFSATKLIWLYQNNTTVQQAVQNQQAYFGTIDAWLLYKFSNGKHYATDYTNASRTMFFNLHFLQWDEELIKDFGLVGLQLPKLQPSSSHFGETNLNGLLPLATPIHAMIGDSHAAAFGEGCFESGTAKATLGTGCSILMNVGSKPVQSTNGMVTTVCWSMEDRIDYALEGVIVSCGATIEWLKNELQLFASSTETEEMALSIHDNAGVYIVPAFSGLGSPYWQPDRKASIVGLTFGSTKKHIVRAALETIPYQIKDVIVAMEKDANISLQTLMIDGGITANTFVVQFLTNLLNKQVNTIQMPDVSALGAAYLAGLKAKVFTSLEQLTELNQNKKTFLPQSNVAVVLQGYEGWKKVINTI